MTFLKGRVVEPHGEARRSTGMGATPGPRGTHLSPARPVPSSPQGASGVTHAGRPGLGQAIQDECHESLPCHPAGPWDLTGPLHGHWDPHGWPGTGSQCCWSPPNIIGVPLLRPACYSPSTSTSSFCLNPSSQPHLLPEALSALPALGDTQHPLQEAATPRASRHRLLARAARRQQARRRQGG